MEKEDNDTVLVPTEQELAKFASLKLVRPNLN